MSYYFTAIDIGQRVGCRNVAPLGKKVISNLKGFLQFCRMTPFFHKSRAYRFSISEDWATQITLSKVFDLDTVCAHFERKKKSLLKYSKWFMHNCWNLSLQADIACNKVMNWYAFPALTSFLYLALTTFYLHLGPAFSICFRFVSIFLGNKLVDLAHKLST